MEHQENTCPCCPRHCPLSTPGCEKGRRFAAGEAAAPGHGPYEHHHGRHTMPDLDSTSGLLCACGHALHHRETGGDEPFAALTEAERTELERILKKLLDSWGRE